MHRAGAARLQPRRFDCVLATIAGSLLAICPPVAQAAPSCGALAQSDAFKHEAAHAATPDERFRCARRLAQQRAYAAAIREFRALSAEYPGNVDYLFGEAQARFWSGDAHGALRLLPRARELAPDYEDVWRLEQQVLDSLDGAEAARRREAFRAAALRQFPDAEWLEEESPLGPAAKLGWEAGVNVDTLDNGADDWRHAYAHLGWHSPNERSLWVTVADHRRFALTDTDLSFGGALKPTPEWLLEGGVHVVPDTDFLPELVVDAGVSRVLDGGWVAGVDLRQRRYPEQTVTSYGVELERYFGRYRAAGQLQATQLGSTTSFVYTATLNYYAEAGSRYGITLATGDEVEVVAPGQLLEMDISAVALSGSHPLNERLSLLWRVGTHRQGPFYRRHTVGLSIAGEF